jgi:urease gamma subunit
MLSQALTPREQEKLLVVVAADLAPRDAARAA